MTRVVVSAAVAVIVLALAVLLWFVDPFGWRNSQPSATAPAPLTSATTPTPSISAAWGEADEVGAALEGLVQNPVAGAAEETRPTVDPDTALPQGSKITPDSSTWAPDGIGGGTMNVVLSLDGQPDRRFVAVMVKEDGEWKVLATFDQTESTDLP